MATITAPEETGTPVPNNGYSVRTANTIVYGLDLITGVNSYMGFTYTTSMARTRGVNSVGYGGIAIGASIFGSAVIVPYHGMTRR